MENSKQDQVNIYINRELSTLEFIRRVHKVSQQQDLPLLERLRFLFICSGLLDEFFEVRVAGLQQQATFAAQHTSVDGLTPQEVLKEISICTHKMVQEIYQDLRDEMLPALKQESIYLLLPEQWTKQQAKWVKNYFCHDVLPLISPVALDFSHPFPKLANKSLNFIVTLEGKDAFGRQSGLAIVHVPRSIPRVIRAPEDIFKDGDAFLFLTSIIHHHVNELFPGMTVTGSYQFRVTRNSDLFLDEEEIEDLALALKTSLFDRSYGSAVRLELAADCPDEIADYLLQKHNLTTDELYQVNGPVNLSRFMMILKIIERNDLRYPPFSPGMPKRLKRSKNIFQAIRANDILLHHPYHSFDPVLDLIHQATLDPDVLAIKQTLYRTGAESKMVLKLIDAARAGKEVTAVIELRARFDEASNIELANRLQEAGALVVYGVVGYKTHAKMTLIVRRENNQLNRYVHLGTGNYHAHTAKEYTDIGLLSYNQEIGEDVHHVFQQLTGMGKATTTEKLLQAPFTLFSKIKTLIENETANAVAGKPARIIAKMNALTEPKIIKALYKASKAGVKIDLIVRGICCLRPGIPGISENIRVISIVGQFLEHSRIFYFLNGGEELTYCSSADWMERNFYYRVEIAFPIEDKKIARQLKEQTLDIFLSDNCLSWELQADGQYILNTPGKKNTLNSQNYFLQELAK